MLISFCFVCAAGNASGDDAVKPTLKAGDRVRFNAVDLLKTPGTVPVWASVEEYRSLVSRYIKSDEKAKAKFAYDRENQVTIGHNTLATVIGVESIEAEDRTRTAVRVGLESGPLKGQNFWANAQNFRLDSEANPALSADAHYARIQELYKAVAEKTPKADAGTKQMSEARKQELAATLDGPAPRPVTPKMRRRHKRPMTRASGWRTARPWRLTR
jgi:hypothetical protein